MIERALVSVATTLLLLAPRAGQAAGERTIYAISIGQNEVPQALRAEDNEALPRLRYADDDAASFHTFIRGTSRAAVLLSVLDTDTQRRFPELAREARPPTRAQLQATVDAFKKAMDDDVAAGREPVLVFFYSGHCIRDASGAAALALEDGALNGDWLYDSLLGRLPARLAHVIVDACRAEAVVRPRDVYANVEPMDEPEHQRRVQAATLARFPHVGAILASSATAQSFEWDAYRGGVFAHELLSGLRGAADVNRDGSIEYSELAAFLAAANLQVTDPRARLDIVVQAPRADRRAQLLDLTRVRNQVVVAGRAGDGWERPFFVEDERGTRLLDAYVEKNGAVRLLVPAGERLYLVRADGEVEIREVAGAAVDLGRLRVRRRESVARGALDESLRRGLFATAFGPSFYRGYVSQQPDLLAVEFEPAEVDLRTPAPAPAAPRDPRRSAGVALLGAATVGAIATGVFGALTWKARSDHDATKVERTATDASARYQRYGTLTWIAGGSTVLLGAGSAALLSASGRF